MITRGIFLSSTPMGSSRLSCRARRITGRAARGLHMLIDCLADVLGVG
jgi:hypothetical protein